MTNFIDVINVSATHIYHSALELSPLSSIVRKLYYSQQPCSSPKVVIGVPDSWQLSIASVSTSHFYHLSSTWSPCGQFVATVSEKTIEIRDSLTLKLLPTLQLPEGAMKFSHGIAYSPDGQYLAGCSNAAIIIWDIQTGGLAKQIEFGVPSDCLEIMWSLDGKKVATVLKVTRQLAVHVYEVPSGVMQLSKSIQPASRAQLWAHGESFRMMTRTDEGLKGSVINIFEVGSSLVKIEPFTFRSHLTIRAFSPTTYRVSASTSGKSKDENIFILDTQNSKTLLQVNKPSCRAHCFSPDGGLFMASAKHNLFIWRYASGHYIQWRELNQSEMSLQFSPTSPSVLGYSGRLIHVFHLNYSPTTLSTEIAAPVNSQQLDAFSPSGTYIATAYQHENTITITNLYSETPSAYHFIDTGVKIVAMVLTGSVLLVKGPDKIVAWLLREGVVNGVTNNRRANSSDSLWTKPLQHYAGFLATIMSGGDNDSGNSTTEFVVEGEIAVVMHSGDSLCVYHTETGEILGRDKEPQGREYILHDSRKGDQCSLYRQHLVVKHNIPPECDWPISQATLQEGWVKDSEGKHRFWLPPHWRSSKSDVEWLYNVSALRLRTPSQLVVVKF